MEGLQNLTELQELHLSNQTIKEGAHLTFDPDSLKAITPSLQILSLSTNRISKLDQIAELTNLREVNLSHNEVSDIMVNNFIQFMPLANEAGASIV